MSSPRHAAVSSGLSSGTACNFPAWWQALPAVPSTKNEVDWWANGKRPSIYERLRRVWFDTTRNYWFYRSDQEDHLTTTLWENLRLFHPKDSLPALFNASGLPQIGNVTDACWSYEYEEHSGGRLKQIDVIVHFRDGEGDGLLIVEAKRPRGPLKASDNDPSYYLDLPSFAFTKRRYMLYLVDSGDLAAVKAAVGKSALGHGYLTWQQLESVQRSLTATLAVSASIRDLVSDMLHWHFAKHGVSSSDMPSQLSDGLASLFGRFRLALGMPAAAVAWDDDFAAIASCLRAGGLPPQVCHWLIGMLQHQLAWHGHTPLHPAFDYLHGEPAQCDIVPGMPGRQGTAERRVALWKLP